MSNTIYLCTWDLEKPIRLKVDNVNINGPVKDIKRIATQRFDKELTFHDFTYCGLLLKDEAMLSDYGVTSSSEIHIIKKPTKPFDEKGSKLSEKDVQDFVTAFRVFENPGFRSTLQRLVRSEVFEEMKKTVPEIVYDTIALGILMDPELLIQLVDPSAIRTLGEQHPTLIKGAYYIAKYIKGEQQNSVTPNLPTTSTGYSYTLAALSDDEDMEIGGVFSNRDSPQQPLSRNYSFNAITQAQLAEALANATGSTASQSTSIAGTFITHEMLNSAVQQAFNSGSSNPSNPTSGPRRLNESEMAELVNLYQEQLTKMHEIGLVDDEANLRALQHTNGDLQAAVEFVLNEPLFYS